MLFILFGLPGAGKSYAGRIFAEVTGAFFYDADTDLTEEIKGYINAAKPVPDDVRDRYVNVVIARIGDLQQQHHRLVVAQALIKEKHRHLILQHYPEVIFIWVTAPLSVRVERLNNRKSHFVSPITEEYAAKIAANFENPTVPHHTLENDVEGSEKIRQQMWQLIG